MSPRSEDPLAGLEALAEEWIENGVPARDCCGDHDADEALYAMQAAIAEARALLGEVSVREEFGIIDWGGDPIVDREWTCVADVMRGAHGQGYKVAPGRLVKRTVTTTAHASEWEVVEP